MKQLLLLIVLIWPVVVVGAAENQFNFKTVTEFNNKRAAFMKAAENLAKDTKEPNFYLVSFDPNSDNYAFKTKKELKEAGETAATSMLHMAAFFGCSHIVEQLLEHNPYGILENDPSYHNPMALVFLDGIGDLIANNDELKREYDCLGNYFLEALAKLSWEEFLLKRNGWNKAFSKINDFNANMFLSKKRLYGHKTTENDLTSLHIASYYALSEYVQKMVDHGTDPCIQSYGRVPLQSMIYGILKRCTMPIDMQVEFIKTVNILVEATKKQAVTQTMQQLAKGQKKEEVGQVQSLPKTIDRTVQQSVEDAIQRPRAWSIFNPYNAGIATFLVGIGLGFFAHTFFADTSASDIEQNADADSSSQSG